MIDEVWSQSIVVCDVWCAIVAHCFHVRCYGGDSNHLLSVMKDNTSGNGVSAPSTVGVVVESHIVQMVSKICMTRQHSYRQP